MDGLIIIIGVILVFILMFSNKAKMYVKTQSLPHSKYILSDALFKI